MKNLFKPEFTSHEKVLLAAWDENNSPRQADDAFAVRLLAAYNEAEESSLQAIEAHDEAICMQMVTDAYLEDVPKVEKGMTPQTSMSIASSPHIPLVIPEWMDEALATELRLRLDRLVSARGGSPRIVDESIYELRNRLHLRKWEGPLEQALTGDDSEPARLALTGLAIRICKRRVADELRQMWRKNLLAARNEDAMISMTVEGSVPLPSPKTRELLRVILDAVDRLHDEDRELIAEIVDIELGAQVAPAEPVSSLDRARLHRARARLAAEIAQLGGSGGER